jgi:hypothetical protein
MEDMKMYSRDKIEDLVGKTITKIDNTDDMLVFHCDDGVVYEMYHQQDCCEQVELEDIVGDLDDLINSVVLDAYESTNQDNPKGYKSYADNDKIIPDDSFTWTFYSISTAKGFVTLKWYGTSNGYYSEGVDFVKRTIQ